MTSSGGYAEVIGDPIAHSKSPIIHNFWLKALGIDGDYRATQVARPGLAEFITQRRGDAGWRGCNVTMPLKLDALLLAEERSDRAVAAGAANLLMPKDGNLLAGNTDVGAVLQVLKPLLEQGVTGDITLLGNGGAARAALVALRMAGIDNVCLQARDISAAFALALEFGLQIQPRTFDQPVETDGLINATPLGMAGVEPFAIDIQQIPATGWVVDMVTDPIETPLLKSAKTRGLTAVDGLAMLVEQAAASFNLLFSHEAPRQLDDDLYGQLRA
jgi:shikimate dehydrogenase